MVPDGLAVGVQQVWQPCELWRAASLCSRCARVVLSIGSLVFAILISIQSFALCLVCESDLHRSTKNGAPQDLCGALSWDFKLNPWCRIPSVSGDMHTGVAFSQVVLAW